MMEDFLSELSSSTSHSTFSPCKRLIFHYKSHPPFRFSFHTANSNQEILVEKTELVIMGKLTVFAALFAALLTVASATSYKTVVTTTVEDEGTNSRGQSCMQEIQEKQMQHCRMWMQRMGRPYEVSLRSNPRYQEEHLQECCQQLENISSPCRCEAMKQMWREQQQSYETEEMQQMKQKLESLPRMCDMKSPKECRMPSMFY